MVKIDSGILKREDPSKTQDRKYHPMLSLLQESKKKLRYARKNLLLQNLSARLLSTTNIFLWSSANL